ncbi:TetR/AcrR family transcriptional regulator [Streptomyces sp. NPDC051940]|uniref:TetR/AcrR family transcriptional regulator n=1 Tax=Streptomyces sp. NPDC051940 TaxID=3155675 RepID=UPI00342FE908
MKSNGTGRSGGGSREEQVDQRRAELLEAARKVVLERGLANTRVADIAKATDVSGGLIHYHFATKDVLLTEMLRAASMDDIRTLQEVADSPGSSVDRMDAVLHFYLPEEDNAGWVLWLEAWAASVRVQSLRNIVGELDGAWLAVVERVIRDGVRSGEFTCDDPAAAAERLDALLDGLAIRYTLQLGAMTRRHYLEQARVAASREVGVDRSVFPRGR